MTPACGEVRAPSAFSVNSPGRVAQLAEVEEEWRAAEEEEKAAGAALAEKNKEGPILTLYYEKLSDEMTVLSSKIKVTPCQHWSAMSCNFVK